MQSISINAINHQSMQSIIINAINNAINHHQCNQTKQTHRFSAWRVERRHQRRGQSAWLKSDPWTPMSLPSKPSSRSQHSVRWNGWQHCERTLNKTKQTKTKNKTNTTKQEQLGEYLNAIEKNRTLNKTKNKTKTKQKTKQTYKHTGLWQSLCKASWTESNPSQPSRFVSLCLFCFAIMFQYHKHDASISSAWCFNIQSVMLQYPKHDASIS